MDNWRIVEAQEKYCKSHCENINAVSFEGKYLSTNNGFSLTEIVAFYRYCEERGYPQFYVIDENERVVGWCDIVEREGWGSDVGFIGIGLAPEYRDKGIGTKLMKHAMAVAYWRGFRTIRLDCRASNKRALHVYKKLGFRREWLNRSKLVLDGQNIPLVCMVKRLRKEDAYTEE
ncbi:MAG: GNAT family N-acetyltransferase [Ruminococcaceae bacterium]|nr:GNAT family N-acetyltransferase [Oscillospiraceae bacterium]